MNRSDSRKEMGAGLARSPAQARRIEEEDATESVHREADDPLGHEGEDSSEARSPAAARKGAEAHAKYERSEELGERGVVKSGKGIQRETVEADHVIGDGGKMSTASAEGEADLASAKANRKEAMEPEREMSEQAAVGRDRAVAHKNVMGHGERETVAKHTI